MSLALAAAAPLLLGTTGLTSNLDQRLLAAHNRERNAAGIPPLRWNPALAASAEQWSERLAREGRIYHYHGDPDDPEPEGENIWAGTKGYFPPEAMVGLWIEEKKHFRAGPFPHNSRTGRVGDIGHYTQLMWRSTGEVGCAVSRGQIMDVLVCRYSEAGNVIGEQPF